MKKNQNRSTFILPLARGSPRAQQEGGSAPSLNHCLLQIHLSSGKRALQACFLHFAAEAGMDDACYFFRFMTPEESHFLDLSVLAHGTAKSTP